MGGPREDLLPPVDVDQPPSASKTGTLADAGMRGARITHTLNSIE